MNSSIECFLRSSAVNQMFRLNNRAFEGDLDNIRQFSASKNTRKLVLKFPNSLNTRQTHKLTYIEYMHN